MVREGDKLNGVKPSDIVARRMELIRSNETWLAEEERKAKAFATTLESILLKDAISLALERGEIVAKQ